MIGDVRFELGEIGSTNDAARAAFLTGAAADGSVFIASHQTAGRGRRGAKWEAKPGESVLMTVVLRRAAPISLAWRTAWTVSVAVQDCLATLGLNVSIKWPNDITVDGRKIAGILVETVAMRADTYAALLGIGINVRQQGFDHGQSYRVPPTSISLELNGRPLEISDVIDRLCGSLNRFYSESDLTWPDVVSSYSNYLVCGQIQTGLDVETGDLISGRLLSVRESDGAAGLETSDGLTRYVFPEGL